MRPITHKQVQTVFHCVCGYNVVDHATYPIRWCDLAKAGITRKKDKTTGKPFLLQRQKSDTCHCNDND